MIVFLRSWIEQIVIAVVVASIFEMILPNSNTKKYIKMVLGLFIVFNIISSFVNSKELYSFKVTDIIDDYSSQSVATSSNSKNRKIEDMYIKEIENDISKSIEELGFKVKSCKIDAVIYSDNNAAGINKIDIQLAGKIDNNKQNLTNTNIETVEAIEINIGEKEEESKITEKDINKLKKSLSKHYEVDKRIIDIK